MKQFTLKELSNLTNTPTPTLRRALLKPIVGEVYHKDVWNQKALRDLLTKYDVDEKVLGCKIDEVECIKSKKESSRDYIQLKDLQINQMVILHNYSFEKEVKLVEVRMIGNEKAYIFKDEKGNYKTYSEDQLNKKNIRFEEIER